MSNITEGSRTPWGQAQYVEHPDPGIAIVDTAGHGGVKLSSRRNKLVPAPLRNSSGWYEEDCEAYIATLIYPAAFARNGEDVDAIQERSRQGVINWFPEKYEKFTGVRLPIGASYIKDKRTWEQLHADDEVVISAQGDWADDVPEGMVAVTVTRGGRYGNAVGERVVLVPKEDYDNPEFKHPLGKHSGSFVVDPSKHYLDITPPPKRAAKPAVRYRGIDTSSLTASQRDRAERELDKRWRFHDGEVKSLRQIIESGGISGKSYVENNSGRKEYYLRYAVEAEGEPASDSSYALKVSKATWDASVAPEPPGSTATV
ncbi:MAG: DUF7007 domain-containing protein [Acidimicrobiales bacterium]